MGAGTPIAISPTCRNEVSPATTTFAASASAAPALMAYRSSATTSGTRHLYMAACTSTHEVNGSFFRSAPATLRSMPLQNAPPEPDNKMQPTSDGTFRNASRSSTANCCVIAFFRSGRFRTMSSRFPTRSTMTFCSLMAITTDQACRCRRRHEGHR